MTRRAWFNDPAEEHLYKSASGRVLGRIEVYPSIYCAVKESGEKLKFDDFEAAEAWLLTGDAPESASLRFIASGSGHWIALDKTVLWHHYSDDPNNLQDLDKLTQNILKAVGVQWREAEEISDLWPRLDRIEERTGTAAVEILELMLARGRF